MVFKLNIIAVKLMPEEDIMDLLQFYQAVPVIALFKRTTYDFMD
jgi:hypothetical protein